MISNIYRFHGYGSLRYVYSNGKTIRGQFFSLKYIINPKRERYRLAVIVSRKVSKSAVIRNRIRRRLYEIFRHLENKISGSYDIALVVYSENMANMPADQLNQEVKNLLKQARIIKES